jgi:hypothetical protein
MSRVSQSWASIDHLASYEFNHHSWSIQALTCSLRSRLMSRIEMNLHWSVKFFRSDHLNLIIYWFFKSNHLIFIVDSTSRNDSVRFDFCHLEIESMSIRFLDDFDSIRFDSIRVFIDSKSLKKWSLKFRLLIVDIISNIINIHVIYFRRAFIISFLNNHILFICEKRYDYSEKYNIVRFFFSQLNELRLSKKK